MRTSHESIVTADRGGGKRLRKSPFGASSARGRQRKADLCEEGTGPGSASGVVASTSWNTLNLFHGAGDDGRVEPENQTAKRRDDSAANHKGLHLATVELAAVLRQEDARFSGVGFSPEYFRDMLSALALRLVLWTCMGFADE
jgi:hypothetical protein